MRIISFAILFVFGFAYGQHQEKVDFHTAIAQIVPNAIEKEIVGVITYDFEVMGDVDSLFLDARNMDFTSVLLNQKNNKFKIANNRIIIVHPFKKGESHTLKMNYIARPKQSVYFLGWDDGQEGNEQIWTQGQGKYSSHWLPSFDDMTEKVVFDLCITADEKYEVIANGTLLKKEREGPTSIKWNFDMQKPMSSYLLAFAIGNYNRQKLTSTSGIPIENYYYPKDSLNAEPTYRYSREIFDFFEKEIGVSYPWQDYKQVPVRDFLYAGMENTGATFFSDGYVIDSIAFIDWNFVNVNAHEMAHQWFGNLVTEVDGNHHWLHEGFATYYALLAEKKLFGNSYFYWKLYDTAKQLSIHSNNDKGEALNDAKASSLTFYEKGAWALVMLREEIGDRAFRAGIQNYLKKYQFRNVTISNFIHEMEHSSGIDLTGFQYRWLESDKFQTQEVDSFLSKNSEEIGSFIKMRKKWEQRPEDPLEISQESWNTFSSALKSRVIGAHPKTLSTSFLIRSLQHDSIKVRQAIALSTNSITSELQVAYESLLKDRSYRTVENALMNLWVAFPDQRIGYLNQTKDCIGLPNKNVRLLWLTLAVLTDGYEPQRIQSHFQELVGYTSNLYSWEIRMGAFQYLNEALGLNDTGLSNLFEGTSHHSWQFRKYARNLLDELLKDPDYKNRISALAKELKGEEFRYIKTKLE